MKNIILSAFSRYGDYPANSSELVAESLQGTVPAGYLVHTEIFPATIPDGENRGASLLNAAASLNASGIVCLGMASKKRSLCIETIARNITYGKYCPPELEENPINSDNPLGEQLPIDLYSWQIKKYRNICQRARISVRFSCDAGGFCCNHLMYQMEDLRLRNESFRSIPWIFMHIPCSPEAVPPSVEAFTAAGKVTMSVNDMVRGVEILLANASI
jgi:pyrrolidone-carboxylate peptidase